MADRPTLSYELSMQAVYFVEGVLMVGGNALLIAVILSIRRLRQRHEILLLVGLAFADLLYGVGSCASGVSNGLMKLRGEKPKEYSRWECFWTLRSFFFMLGPTAGSLMMAVVSLDRLLAVAFFSFYMGLTTRYSRNMILLVFGLVGMWMTGAGVMAFLWRHDGTLTNELCLGKKSTPSWYYTIKSTAQTIGEIMSTKQSWKLENGWHWQISGFASVVIFILTYVLHRQHKAKIAPGRRDGIAEHKRQRKMTLIIGITVLVTFFTHTIPNITFMILQEIPNQKTLFRDLYPWIWSLVRINSIVNVVIFTLTIQDVRVGVLAYLRCRKPNFNGSQYSTRRRQIEPGAGHGRRTGTSLPSEGTSKANTPNSFAPISRY